MVLTHPISFKAASSTAAGIVAILSAVWGIDNHYASAADVDKLQRSVETQVRTMRQERVEDELFKLDIKKEQNGKLTPEEAALYQRYTRRLQQTITEQQISDKEVQK